MKEIFTVFRKKSAWGHMVLSAVVFFAIALPFRSLFTLLPGVTEIRPANMVPLVFGIQFGPGGRLGHLHRESDFRYPVRLQCICMLYGVCGQFLLHLHSI